MTIETVLKPPYLHRYTEAEYHADPCPTPSLTQSTAKTLLNKSPYHAFCEHPRFGNHKREASAEMNKGTLIHSMLLGTGKEIVAVDAANWMTKAAKEIRDEALLLGQLPMLKHEVEEAEEIVAAIRKQLDEFGIVLGSEREIAAVWEEESECGPVLCRGMFDALEPRVRIDDLKTLKCAHPLKIQKQMCDLMYDLQWAAYTSAFNHLWPEMAGRGEFLFVFVETEYPFCVTPVRPNGEMQALGQSRWRRAVELWGRCLHTGQWPKYTDGVVEIAPTSWAMYAEELACGDVL